jgi:hypothetical protein
MFGGVDALADSQDWWLRDQANLAVGFDNWMGMGTSEDIGAENGTATSPDLANLTGVGPGFYIPPTDGRNHGFGGDDDWNYT